MSRINQKTVFNEQLRVSTVCLGIASIDRASINRASIDRGQLIGRQLIAASIDRNVN